MDSMDSMRLTKAKYYHVDTNDNAVSILSLVYRYTLRRTGCGIQRHREELDNSC